MRQVQKGIKSRDPVSETYPVTVDQESCKGAYASVRLRQGLDSNCRITVAQVDLSESLCRIEW